MEVRAGYVPQEADCEARHRIAAAGSIYESLGMTGSDGLRARLEGYLGSVGGYCKNRHDELTTALRERIARDWHQSFEEWDHLLIATKTVTGDDQDHNSHPFPHN